MFLLWADSSSRSLWLGLCTQDGSLFCFRIGPCPDRFKPREAGQPSPPDHVSLTGRTKAGLKSVLSAEQARVRRIWGCVGPDELCGLGHVAKCVRNRRQAELIVFDEHAYFSMERLFGCRTLNRPKLCLQHSRSILILPTTISCAVHTTCN